MKYRIKWKNKQTNFEGEDSFLDQPLEILQEAAKSANEKYPILSHWVVNERGEKIK